MVDTALRALEWLADLHMAAHDHFVPIGSNGFYPRGGTRARFDQQPVEAHAMVSACLAAQTATGESKWGRRAHLAFDWFLGRNDLHLSLYDPATGGCRDGLHSDRLNQNEGAESTLAFLLALLEIRIAETLTPSGGDPGGVTSAVATHRPVPETIPPSSSPDPAGHLKKRRTQAICHPATRRHR
jgi:hypothetical protein